MTKVRKWLRTRTSITEILMKSTFFKMPTKNDSQKPIENSSMQELTCQSFIVQKSNVKITVFIMRQFDVNYNFSIFHFINFRNS